MPTVKIPGIGPVEKKWVYIGGAAVAGIVGYAYWTRVRESEPEVSDYTGEATGEYAYDGSVDEYVNPGGSEAPVEEDYNPAPSNNVEWGQKATSILIDLGYEPIAAGIAVGQYLLRQKLAVTQAEMIRTATGQLGPPPSGTFPIDTTPTPPATQYPAGTTLKGATGLKQVSSTNTSIGLDWNEVDGAVGYFMYVEGHGKPYGYSRTSNGIMGGLPKRGAYTVYVRAVGADDGLGAKSSGLRARTK